MKKLIIVICFLLLSSALSLVSNEGNLQSATVDKTLAESFKKFFEVKTEYTYVWELREGVWWILVYDEDGKLVNEYPID